MRIKKAIIPAAGLGTRFLPATKAQPKEMLPIVDKPSIQYIIEEAVAAGIEDILIITGPLKIILIILRNWNASWRKKANWICWNNCERFLTW